MTLEPVASAELVNIRVSLQLDPEAVLLFHRMMGECSGDAFEEFAQSHPWCNKIVFWWEETDQRGKDILCVKIQIIVSKVDNPYSWIQNGIVSTASRIFSEWLLIRLNKEKK